MIRKRLLTLAGRVVGWVLAGVGVTLLCSALSIAVGLSIAELLTAAVAGDRDALAGSASLVAGLLFARGFVVWWREVVLTGIGVRIRRRLRRVLLSHLESLGPAAIADQRSGSVASTIIDGVESLDPYYSRYLPSLVASVVLPLALIGYLWTVDSTVALVLFVALIVGTVPGRMKDATLLERGAERWEKERTLSADLLDAIQVIPTLKLLGATKRTEGRLAEAAWALYRITMRQLRVSLLDTGFTGLAAYGGAAAATIVAAVGAWRGDIAVGDAFVVLMLSREVFRPLTDLRAAWHAGYLGISAAAGIDSLLSAKSSVAFDGDRVEPAAHGRAVMFRGVTFAYSDDAVLRDLDLEVPGGATVAIIGPSGSGKTTALRLLQRAADPDDGVIEMDGTPITDFTRDALTASLAVVSQHATVFAGTVADNIALGSSGATREQIVEAARVAQAHDFVSGLADGYDTVLGELGSGLSGGQKQRIALARAVLQDRPVLVLDEATAHLDVRTEAAVTRALAARQGRTTIIVTHRIEAADDADLVAEIEAGRVVRVRAGAKEGAR